MRKQNFINNLAKARGPRVRQCWLITNHAKARGQTVKQCCLLSNHAKTTGAIVIHSILGKYVKNADVISGEQ